MKSHYCFYFARHLKLSTGNIYFQMIDLEERLGGLVNWQRFFFLVRAED